MAGPRRARRTRARVASKGAETMSQMKDADRSGEPVRHQEFQAPRISARFADLADKTAIVTGASRGIGVGIAEFLGDQGMKLMLTARTHDKGAAVAESLGSRGIQCRWVAADLTTADGAEAALADALEAWGRIDLLVNNAAQIHSKPFLELDDETFTDSHEANGRMLQRISTRVAQHMAAAGGGNIVNISSVGGLRAHRRNAGYDASKGAVDALTRAMAMDLAPHGIRVNAVAPGATLRSLKVKGFFADFAEQAAGHIPLGRLGFGQEIGAAVAFLASDAGAYITGQVLYVDGGLTAQLTPPSISV